MPLSPFLPRLLYNLLYLGQTSVGTVRLWDRDLPWGESSLLQFFSCVPPSHSISEWWQRGAGGSHPCRAGEALGSAGERRGWGHPGKRIQGTRVSAMDIFSCQLQAHLAWLNICHAITPGRVFQVRSISAARIRRGIKEKNATACRKALGKLWEG